MRIIGGTVGGATIAAPKGQGTRPMTARVREAIFNILGPGIVDTAVLDLFAGSGSLGLEALSRGATRCAFVERDRRAADVLRRNIVTLGFLDRARVIIADATRLTAGRLKGRFDLVFADPPYALAEDARRGEGDSDLGRLLRTLFDRRVLKQRGQVILRAPFRAGVPWTPDSAEVVDMRRYGTDRIHFVRRARTA